MQRRTVGIHAATVLQVALFSALASPGAMGGASAKLCAVVGLPPPAVATLMVSNRNASEGLILTPDCEYEYVPTQLVASEYDDITDPMILFNCSSRKITIEAMVSHPYANILFLDSSHIHSYNFTDDVDVLDLVLSWNDLETLDDFMFPPELRKLDLEGNLIMEIAGDTIPASVTSLSLSQTRFTASGMDKVLFPASLEFLYLYNSLIEKINFTLPQTLVGLYMDDSHIPAIEYITFPDTLEVFSCINCQTNTFRGVQLSPNLSSLNLDSSRLINFEIRESDKEILLNLDEWLGVISQPTCSEPTATMFTFQKGYNVCVISDDLFVTKYGMIPDETSPSLPSSSSSSPSPSSTPSTSSSSAFSAPLMSPTLVIVICILSGLLVIVIALAAYFFIQRRRSNNAVEKLDGDASGLTLQLPHTLGSTGNSSSQEGYLTNDIRNDDTMIPYRIAQDELQLVRRIAHGGYGVIYQGKFQGRAVAVKQLLPERSREIGIIKSFMDEIRLCARLDHPRITEFIGVSWSTLIDLAVVIEYMEGGDLHAALYEREGYPEASEWFHASVNLKAKAQLALEIIEAVVYLHSFESPVIHRDLKTRNVLLNKDGDAKLSDFGISREATLDETMTGEIGTAAWIAPEVLRGERYSEKADIYSFGVVLVELDTCRRLYSAEVSPGEGDNNKSAFSQSNAHIALQVSAGLVTPSLSKTCPPRVSELAVRCMSFMEADRPSAVEIHYELRKIRHGARSEHGSFV